ncbi:hypothetical protein SGLAM104S_08744 [Streptomyces glaucescens]
MPPLQKRVLDQAHGAATLASAVNIGAFNLGNALSAWLGGLVIAAGLGYTAPNWVGAALLAAAEASDGRNGQSGEGKEVGRRGESRLSDGCPRRPPVSSGRLRPWPCQ